MHIFYTPNILEQAFLPEEESAHCVRVLRLCNGEEIQVTDGKGNFYRCRITETHPKHCAVEILEVLPQKADHSKMSVAIAPTKNMDRMEWLTEKLTEIGVDEIFFLNCRYSERKVIKTDRLTKIAISAMKQSLRATLPTIAEIEDFKRFVQKDFDGQKFICHCYPEAEAGKRFLLKNCYQDEQPSLVLIGPEGDFSLEEVKLAQSLHFTPISLGEMRLRTETAALAAGLTMQLIHTK